ncbi:MAG: TRAP transporter fused permease subunit [Clostridiales bacterium]|nr:TRAP transporter fused permease subunit [Clostridiales bacterium]
MGNNNKQAQILGKLVLLVSTGFVCFHLYTAIFGVLPGIGQKSVHLGCLLVIFYLNAIVEQKNTGVRILLMIMCLFGVVSCVYITAMDTSLQARAGIIYNIDIVCAVLLIISIFEACRRKMGNALVIITLIFILYAFFGKYVPGFLNQPGMTLKKFTNLIYLTTNGIWGSALYASSSYVVIFVMLGSIMSVSGIGDYFTDLATALFGAFRGGPAKVSVVASGLFGSISGSPTANVIGTGTFTIPLMKKNGFEDEYAAAVEATASTGGAIMPPIMGSTAFVMAELIGVPYSTIAAAALIPAILYFMSILFAVDIHAAKHGLKGIPRKDLPNLRALLKEIYKLFPLVFLVLCMSVFNFTVTRSGLYTVIVTLLIVELDPKTRLSREQWMRIPLSTAKSAVSVGIACAMAGIISGVIMGSGLGYRISSILTTVAGQSMLLLLVLTMLVSLIMGMGVPTTAAYLVLAALVAPTLTSLGISTVAAHMFIFYFGCISSITPPVAMAAYAGAAISGCDPNRAGYKAFRLAICAFIMPYMFVYNPVLLMQGEVLETIQCLITALLGAYMLGAGFEGFFWNWKLKWFERPVLIGGALLLIVPGVWTDLIGILIVVIEFASSRIFNRKFVEVSPTVS